MKFRIEEIKSFDSSEYRIQFEDTTLFRKRKVWRYYIEHNGSNTHYKYEDALLHLNRVQFGTKIIYHTVETVE